jgi:hypothetical protein
MKDIKESAGTADLEEIISAMNLGRRRRRGGGIIREEKRLIWIKHVLATSSDVHFCLHKENRSGYKRNHYPTVDLFLCINV